MEKYDLLMEKYDVLMWEYNELKRKSSDKADPKYDVLMEEYNVLLEEYNKQNPDEFDMVDRTSEVAEEPTEPSEIKVAKEPRKTWERGCERADQTPEWVRGNWLEVRTMSLLHSRS
jgi:hypothetical protein